MCNRTQRAQHSKVVRAGRILHCVQSQLKQLWGPKLKYTKGVPHKINAILIYVKPHLR